MKARQDPFQAIPIHGKTFIVNAVLVKMRSKGASVHPHQLFSTEQLRYSTVQYIVSANTRRNKHVIITSKRCFDVIITCLLRFVFAGMILKMMKREQRWYMNCARRRHHSLDGIFSINPFRAKFFRGNINIHLHFVSFLQIYTMQVVEILLQIRQEPTYST